MLVPFKFRNGQYYPKLCRKQVAWTNSEAAVLCPHCHLLKTRSILSAILSIVMIKFADYFDRFTLIILLQRTSNGS